MHLRGCTFVFVNKRQQTKASGSYYGVMLAHRATERGIVWDTNTCSERIERESWRGKNERWRKEEGALEGMLPVGTYAPVSGSGPGKVSRHLLTAATPHRVIEGQEFSLCPI